MAKIPNTALSWVDIAAPDEFVLANGDTLDFRGVGHVLILRNPTGAPISPVLTGSAATFVDLPGVGRCDLTGGLSLGPIAAGAAVALPIGAHYHWLAGAVTLTNCAGLRAISLEDGLGYRAAPLKWDMQRLFWGWVGLMLDPGNTASLFQDAAGTVPVTAAGQPVGLVLDQSGGGRNASQATSAARPTYRVDAGGRAYLEFDGLDDWLTTASMSFAAGGRTIISALRKRSDAGGTKVVVETLPLWTSTPGGFLQFAPSPPGPATYGSRVQTSAIPSVADTPASYAAPHVGVLSSVAAAGSHVVRVNGAQVASDAPAGAISARAAALAVGARNGTELFSTMDLYGLIVIDRALSAQELAIAERWAAQKCGVVL